jgi:hypothetical protein
MPSFLTVTQRVTGLWHENSLDVLMQEINSCSDKKRGFNNYLGFGIPNWLQIR